MFLSDISSILVLRGYSKAGSVICNDGNNIYNESGGVYLHTTTQKFVLGVLICTFVLIKEANLFRFSCLFLVSSVVKNLNVNIKLYYLWDEVDSRILPEFSVSECVKPIFGEWGGIEVSRVSTIFNYKNFESGSAKKFEKSHPHWKGSGSISWWVSSYCLIANLVRFPGKLSTFLFHSKHESSPSSPFYNSILKGYIFLTFVLNTSID